MERFARDHTVLFWEEPIFLSEPGAAPRLERARCERTGVQVLTPYLPQELDAAGQNEALARLLAEGLQGRTPAVLWYYTPMMLPFTRGLDASCVVYDCMDELSAFAGAPEGMLTLEDELFQRADLVFTGGASLYDAKRSRHPSVHCFPSSIDRRHFAVARQPGPVPAEVADLPAPRLGYCGVIDERLDLQLLDELARARPQWSIVMVGPVVKIDPATLPQRPNLHYLGGRPYDELPAIMRGWDVALMPFALNEATRFISPTKTPEYLAAGLPVVSTAITDVLRQYGQTQAVRIAADPADFVTRCDEALALSRSLGDDWLAEADALLSQNSWDATQSAMAALIAKAQSSGKAAVSAVSSMPMIRPSRHYDVVVVGAGFAGSVMAERLAADAGQRVLVLDRRPHIAGNAYDHHDEAGILIHQYGPHIFHTNAPDIFAYLSRFTRWRPYEHRVLAEVEGQLLPIPINRTTLNRLYGLELASDVEAAEFLASRAEPVPVIRTSRDVVVSAVGEHLYRLFFEGYTRKQWGIDPSDLDKAVTARVPTRTNTDDRYFTDRFQFMPLEGYTRMFARMLDHPNITLELGVDWDEARPGLTYDHLVFTGPIDEFFGHRFGKLPYRSLRFEHRTLDREWLQPVAVINYPHPDVPYTRVTEYKHLTGQEADRTSVTYEYPSADGDPYYPIPRDENQALYKRYAALAAEQEATSFVGRLATYRYYNMDQVVGQALATYRRLMERRGGTAAAEPARASATAA
ncbi:UDP-galactopyranose mutase [Erythrobacteraceae bacterium CFH 75059]|nr:UDP-galactopyranose mutase [Erythrobacteraceae bacterium CFH 75059]